MMTDAERAARIQEAYGRVRAILVEAERIAGGYLLRRTDLSAAEGRLVHLAVLLRHALRDFPERPGAEVNIQSVPGRDLLAREPAEDVSTDNTSPEGRALRRE